MNTPNASTVGNHFWLGWGTCACSLAAFQDWVGKERYMRWIDEQWMHLSPWITTIGAVLFLTLHIVGQWKSRHANDEHTDGANNH